MRTSISYFNALTNEVKAMAVANLHPQEFQPQEHLEHLSPMMVNVQRAMSKYTSMTIINCLVELGLEDTYAMLIVTNMKKQAPTLEYHLSLLSKMDDDKFENSIEEIIIGIWLDHINPDELITKSGIDQEQYNAIAKISTDLIIQLLRNETNEKMVSIIYTKNGLSRKKTEAFLNSIRPHLPKLYSGGVFSQIQDIFAKIEELEAQNIAIMRNMQSILELLKKMPVRRPY